MELNEARRTSEVKLSWWKVGFVGIVLTGALLTIFLAGTVPQQTIRIVNGQEYLGPAYMEAPNATIGYTDSLAGWDISTVSHSVLARLNGSDGALSISGSFKPDSSAASLLISKAMLVNLTEFPIMYLRIDVSQGVGYGIRASSSTADNKTISLWSNSDTLDHRPGLGQFENIQVNMLALSKLNDGAPAANISSIQMYVERASGSTSTDFSFTLARLEFLRFTMGPLQSGQQYHSVYFTFGKIPVNGSAWALDKIDLGLQLTGSSGASYELFQLNGSTAQGGEVLQYSPVTSSYQYSLYPRSVAQTAENGVPEPAGIFTDMLPPSGGFTIAVVALSGTLSQVKLQSVSFVYTPVLATLPTTATTTTVNGDYWYLYLVFFLFLLPLTVALVLYDEFRRDRLTKRHLGLALGVGVACRLALAPVALQPFDLGIYATSARGWFEYGMAGASLGPTLPFTFSLYWVSYSFYAVLLKLGFHDFYILGHQIGFVESIFLKGFPIVSDLAIFYMLMKFNPGRAVKILAVFYLLNPLAIYISSVWGQYEAGTTAFMVLGFLCLSSQMRLRQDMKASFAFILSTLVEIVGIIPLAFLFLRSLFSRPFRPVRALLLLSPLVLLFVYPPELHLIYLVFEASIGASWALLLAQPNTPYTIISNFPAVVPYHPLLVLLVALTAVFVYRRRFEVKDLVSFTVAAFVVFLLFAAQQPQWWLFLFPLGMVYAAVSKNYGMGMYLLVFGAVTAFLILSFTQGSGYVLFGSARFNVVPAIEDIRNHIDLYTTTTTVGAVAALGYLVTRGSASGSRTLLRSSVVLGGTLLLGYFWFTLVGVNL